MVILLPVANARGSTTMKTQRVKQRSKIVQRGQ
jgi:hypothetical protein